MPKSASAPKKSGAKKSGAKKAGAKKSAPKKAGSKKASAPKKAGKARNAPAQPPSTVALGTEAIGGDGLTYVIRKTTSGQPRWFKVTTNMPRAALLKKQAEGTRNLPAVLISDAEEGKLYDGFANSACKKDPATRCQRCKGKQSPCPREAAKYAARKVGGKLEFVCVSHPKPPSKVSMGVDKDGRPNCVKTVMHKGFQFKRILLHSRCFPSGWFLCIPDAPGADTFPKLPAGLQVENKVFYSDKHKQLMIVQRTAVSKERPQGRLQTFRWKKYYNEERKKVSSSKTLSKKDRSAGLRAWTRCKKQLVFHRLIPGNYDNLMRNPAGSIVFKGRSESAKKLILLNPSRLAAFREQQQKMSNKASASGTKKKASSGKKKATSGKKKASKKRSASDAAAGAKKPKKARKSTGKAKASKA